MKHIWLVLVLVVTAGAVFAVSILLVFDPFVPQLRPMGIVERAQVVASFSTPLAAVLLAVTLGLQTRELSEQRKASEAQRQYFEEVSKHQEFDRVHRALVLTLESVLRMRQALSHNEVEPKDLQAMEASCSKWLNDLSGTRNIDRDNEAIYQALCDLLKVPGVSRK